MKLYMIAKNGSNNVKLLKSYGYAVVINIVSISWPPPLTLQLLYFYIFKGKLFSQDVWYRHLYLQTATSKTFPSTEITECVEKYILILV